MSCDFDSTTPPWNRMSDPEKLRTLADWFDSYGADQNKIGHTEFQDDLRRIADNLESSLAEKAARCP